MLLKNRKQIAEARLFRNAARYMPMNEWVEVNGFHDEPDENGKKVRYGKSFSTYIPNDSTIGKSIIQKFKRNPDEVKNKSNDMLMYDIVHMTANYLDKANMKLAYATAELDENYPIKPGTKQYKLIGFMLQWMTRNKNVNFYSDERIYY